MKKLIVAILLAISLAGCNKDETQSSADQAYHSELKAESTPPQRVVPELVQIPREQAHFYCFDGYVYFWSAGGSIIPYVAHHGDQAFSGGRFIKCNEFAEYQP